VLPQKGNQSDICREIHRADVAPNPSTCPKDRVRLCWEVRHARRGETGGRWPIWQWRVALLATKSAIPGESGLVAPAGSYWASGPVANCAEDRREAAAAASEDVSEFPSSPLDCQSVAGDSAPSDGRSAGKPLGLVRRTADASRASLVPEAARSAAGRTEDESVASSEDPVAYGHPRHPSEISTGFLSHGRLRRADRDDSRARCAAPIRDRRKSGGGSCGDPVGRPPIADSDQAADRENGSGNCGGPKRGLEDVARERGCPQQPTACARQTRDTTRSACRATSRL
jgi:hypothetical protein